MIHPWTAPVLDSVRARLGRLPHALLVHGPRGVGKLSLAERIAQLLLCEHADAGQRPCGACAACRWYQAGNHPDFRRLEPEALMKEPVLEPQEETPTSARKGKPSLVIKIEQVRQLADFLYIGSHRGRMRVALVHPAEDMNENAANALLKGLEEPPAGAVFLLVSHRPARLLPTIRSRCVALPVPVPPRDAALAWLAGQRIKGAQRWLSYAGGAPLRAMEFAADAAAIEQALCNPSPVEDREDLERLVEALQKVALDRAFAAFGLPPKYETGASPVRPEQARAWLTYARAMGENRVLARHPLNVALLSTELFLSQPKP
ncbi:MAG TPA: DNA polymerase III subunit delta' [Burkholderiales bacterium]|nr:DNA polymerase III subunit delta' [Burkholderiales bacterium]